MILIFDLDDTLYDEFTYVDSGFSAVAHFAEKKWGWDFATSRTFLRNALTRDGRGRVFDSWLIAHGKWSKKRVTECVRIYRHHIPNLSLFPAARQLLDHYKSRVPLYLVTDGHKVVQQKKIDALDLTSIFRRTFITHRYGISATKPSTRCFEIIRNLENCSWEHMVYIGDDPTKDFIGLNPLGAKTVRVLTGKYNNLIAKDGYDASVTISDLNELPRVL